MIYRHEARSAHGAYNVSVGPFVIPDLRSDKISIYKCPTGRNIEDRRLDRPFLPGVYGIRDAGITRKHATT